MYRNRNVFVLVVTACAVALILRRHHQNLSKHFQLFPEVRYSTGHYAQQSVTRLQKQENSSTTKLPATMRIETEALISTTSNKTTTSVATTPSSPVVLPLHMISFTNTINFPCTGENLADILIFVHTRASNFERRRFIRETWASVRRHDGLRVRTVFAIGRVANSPQIQQQIEDDARQYRDVIQFDFIDSYRNMTIKQLMALRWTQTYCPDARMVVKVDDDVFANVYALTSFLHRAQSNNQTERLKNNTLWCRKQRNTNPLREPNSKWYVTEEEYKPKHYPVYCLGIWTIFFPPTIKHLLQQLSTNVTYLWIDDVFVTGILRELAHMDIAQPPSPFFLTPTVNVLSTPKLHSTAMFYWSESQASNPQWTNITRVLTSLANG